MAAGRTKLTPKERRFVEEYCRDGKFVAAQAAIRACYTENPASARQIGYVLVGKPHIQEAIEARMKELGERCAVTVATITKQLLEDREKAHEFGQAGPAVSASMGLAKLHGLITDKTESKNVSLTHEEWLRSLDGNGTGNAPSSP